MSSIWAQSRVEWPEEPHTQVHLLILFANLMEAVARRVGRNIQIGRQLRLIPVTGIQLAGAFQTVIGVQPVQQALIRFQISKANNVIMRWSTRADQATTVLLAMQT